LERLAADQARAAEGNQDRDEAAWSGLDKVLRHMSHAVPGDKDKKKDAVQVVCAKLQNPATLAQVLNAQSPGAYLMRVLRNTALDRLRLKQPEVLLSERMLAVLPIPANEN